MKEAARRHKPTLSELANRNSYYTKPALLQRFEGLTWNDILDEDEKKEFLAQEEPETNSITDNADYQDLKKTTIKNTVGNNLPSLSYKLPTVDKTNTYTTQSAWLYPNDFSSPFYKRMGRPYIYFYPLGMLSALMESNNGKKLWNNGNLDKTGGWSYGTYQIATKDGTMKDYLKYLHNNSSYQDYYNTLQQAGGYNAALNGNDKFKNTWADLSNNNGFLQSQQQFIVDKKLNSAMRGVNDIRGWNLDSRSPVVRDVLYSTATQHGEGGATKVLHNRFGYNTDISAVSDDDIINNIYNERSNVNQYFSGSDVQTRNRMKERFVRENKKALDLLKKYP